MFLALMDEDGFVQFASVANVAHTARIAEAEAKQAIKILEDPDSNSADQDNNGRRIERVPGGWMILNAKKYRDLVTREMVREQTRERVARHRAKLKGNASVTQRNAKVTQSDTDTDTKKKEGANGSRSATYSGSWLADLSQDKSYEGIDVRREYGKMARWCEVNNKRATRRRFINWLNRVERPMTVSKPTTTGVYGKNRLPPAANITDEEFEAQRKIALSECAKAKSELRKQ